MGKRGPAPKPTNLRLLHGETRPCRINQNEPQPNATNAARCPAHLSLAAKRIWRRLAPQLHAKGLLTEWDRDVLGVFCEAVVGHRAATELVTKGGLLLKGRDGGLVKNPAVTMQNHYAAVIRGFAQEFGLTPSARSGINLPDEGDGDLARLLS